MEAKPPGLLAQDSYDKKIDFVEVFRKLWKQRMSIIIIFFVMTLSALVLSLSSPRMYKAGTTLLSISSPKVYAEETPLGTNDPVGTTHAPQNINVLKAILESTSLREQVVRKGDLLPLLFGDFWDKKKKDWKPGLEHIPTINNGVSALGALLSIIPGKKNPTVTIEVSHHDPATAVRIANLYVDILQEARKSKTFSEVKKNKIFLEQQASQVKGKIGQLKEKVHAHEKVEMKQATQDIYFSVLGRALPPKKPFKPKTTRDVALAAVVGMFIGIAQALFQEYISTAWERRRLG